MPFTLPLPLNKETFIDDVAGERVFVEAWSDGEGDDEEEEEADDALSTEFSMLLLWVLVVVVVEVLLVSQVRQN